nr:hypothetical protein [uncultured Allomuricauda sp.]
MKHVLKLMSFILIMLIAACSSESTEDLIPPDETGDGDDGDNTTEVTYTADIAPLLSSNCLGCHSNPPQNGAPMALTTFSAVQSRASGIFNRTNNGTMPPSGKLPQANIDLIQAWINAGTPE